jgi:hypothetical protein
VHLEVHKTEPVGGYVIAQRAGARVKVQNVRIDDRWWGS